MSVAGNEQADATYRWARGCLELWEQERAELTAALAQLLAASAPYMTDAMPHEHLFSGTDLRNFEAFAAARQRAVQVLGQTLG